MADASGINVSPLVQLHASGELEKKSGRGSAAKFGEQVRQPRFQDTFPNLSLERSDLVYLQLLWRKRHFLLVADRLVYFNDAAPATKCSRLLTLGHSGCCLTHETSPDALDELTFEIRVACGAMRIRADSKAERDRWISSVQRVWDLSSQSTLLADRLVEALSGSSGCPLVPPMQAVQINGSAQDLDVDHHVLHITPQSLFGKLNVTSLTLVDSFVFDLAPDQNVFQLGCLNHPVRTIQCSDLPTKQAWMQFLVACIHRSRRAGAESQVVTKFNGDKHHEQLIALFAGDEQPTSQKAILKRMKAALQLMYAFDPEDDQHHTLAVHRRRALWLAVTGADAYIQSMPNQADKCLKQYIATHPTWTSGDDILGLGTIDFSKSFARCACVVSTDASCNHCKLADADRQNIGLVLHALRVDNIDVEYTPQLQAICVYLVCEVHLSREEAFAVAHQVMTRSRSATATATASSGVPAAALTPYLMPSAHYAVASFGVLIHLIAKFAPQVHERWASAGAFACAGRMFASPSNDDDVDELVKSIVESNGVPFEAALRSSDKLSLFLWWWCSAVETMFLDTFPGETRARFMDAFLLEGELALYRFTIACILAHQDEICSQPIASVSAEVQRMRSLFALSDDFAFVVSFCAQLNIEPADINTLHKSCGSNAPSSLVSLVADHRFSLRSSRRPSVSASSVKSVKSVKPAAPALLLHRVSSRALTPVAHRLGLQLAGLLSADPLFSISHANALRLAAALPSGIHERVARLIFRATRDGSSLQVIGNAFDEHRSHLGLKSFDRSMESIVLIRLNDCLLGAFCSHALRFQKSGGPLSFGSTSCFVFRISKEGDIELWKAGEGANKHTMLTMTSETLAIGGGTGNAIRLCANLSEATSFACSSFNSPKLIHSSDDDDAASGAIMDLVVVAFDI